MNQANHWLHRVVPPLDSSRQDSVMDAVDLPTRKRRNRAQPLTPRDIFLLEVLLAVLAAITILCAGAADGEVLLHLLSGSPWPR